MKKVRVAILGYGRSGGSMHAGAVEANKELFDMVAVADVDEAQRNKAAERFKCAVYADYHEMLRKEKLDLVCVITRSDQHSAMTCDCLKAGAAVLVTKPWAVNEAEAQAMVDAARKTGKLLMPWLPSRWGCTLRRLKTLAQEKAIGETFLIRRVAGSFATRCDWQTERRYGGGYLLNWGPHIIDPAVILGGAPVKSVYGRMKQTINPGDTEDVFMGILTLANGVVAQVEYTIAVETPPDWFVQGTRGTIIANGKKLKVLKNTPKRPDDPTKFHTMGASQTETIEEEVAGAIYGDENEIYREIAAAVRGDKPFAVKPEDALELTRVMDAIRISSQEDRVVKL
ncbi:MAG TPA: Gfo/Idh/MocA family oxidoreductase [Candidatus Brocadiia bacterium]|nr:Gfo/Idh/MocA family oxidoreductase [Candidatus Brocadiia bacterium]